MRDAADPRAEERVGSVLGEKWTLEKLLGVGGMGAVYAARHRNGARAAIKLLHPELARNSEVRERFLREGYAANKVEHRSTVRVLDDDVIKDGPDEGSAYIVMELLEGESLDERAARSRLADREVLEVMDTVLDVLEKAHDKGVVHRDLKPENLFLAKDPDTGLTRLKVLDFGLARIAEAARVTGHGLALGTPAFMSPEQAAGLPDIDGRADLFALGATAFYVLTGKHVHEAETVLQQIIKMAKDPAPKLKTVAPHVDDDVCAIIDRALEVDRDVRYATAAEMRADVRAALERRMDAERTRTLVTAVSIPPEADRGSSRPRASSHAPPTSNAPRKDRRGAFPLGAFLLVGACGAAWFFWPELRARVASLRTGATTLASATASEEPSPNPPRDDGASTSDGAFVVTDLDDLDALDAAANDSAALDADADGDGDGGDRGDGGDAGAEEEDEDEDDLDAAAPVDASASRHPSSARPTTTKPAAPHAPPKKKKKKPRKPAPRH